MAKPIQALLLDLGDTLADTRTIEPTIRRTCDEIAARLPGLDATQLVEANRSAWRDYWAEVEDAWVLGRMDGRAVGIEAWRRTLQHCGYDDPATARWAQERHWQHRSDSLRLFDDAARALQAFNGQVPLALVTNGASDTQRHSLQSLGIEGLFAGIFVSGEHGRAKPDPGVFAAVLNELGVAPGDAWHVGDNLRTDVAGAKAAGLTAVWLNRRGLSRTPEDPEPDHEIRSLDELTRLIPDGIPPQR